MNQSTEIIIQGFEERLKIALLQSDVSVLNELLADDLIFTNHLGHILSKQDDLEAHLTNRLKINELTLSEQKVIIKNDIAIVTVKARIQGTFNHQESDNYFRFTRVWSQISDNLWQIIIAHSSIVV